MTVPLTGVVKHSAPAGVAGGKPGKNKGKQHDYDDQDSSSHYLTGSLPTENAMYDFGRTPVFATRALPVMGPSTETTVIAAITRLARQKAGRHCLENAIA